MTTLNAAAAAVSQATPSEAAVLALILNDGRRIIDAKPYVMPADFALVRHSELYALMLSLHERGKEPNLTAVDGALRLKHSEQQATEWVLWVASAILPYALGDIEQHARQVRDMAYRRRLAHTADQIRALALGGDDDDAPTLAARAHTLLSEAGVNTVGDHEPVTIAQALGEHWDELDKTQPGDSEVSGLPVGWTDYDRNTDGFQPETVNVLAARPGMGKTAFALNVAMHVACVSGPVYAWLGEQTRREATMRMISAKARIDSIKLRRGFRVGGMSAEEYARYTAMAPSVSSLPIFLDDKKAMTVPELVLRATKVHRRRPLSLIVVDYVGLLTPHIRTGNENEQLTVISRAIKTQLAAIAPVLLLSQLNRNVEQRQDKRPMLSDLRASGSIEQDADTVTFLYRDGYYNDMAENPALTEVILAKNRHGQIGTAHLIWQAPYTRFQSSVRRSLA